MVTESVQYKAFLSYTSPDRQLAIQLHRALERVGKRRWWDVRARRVFLDLESREASADLWGKVETALRESTHLIVLASPHAAGSEWVDREIKWWRSHKDASTLLIALADGTVNWDRNATDFTPANGDKATTAIPPALRGYFANEPEWVVLRPDARSPRSPRSITEGAGALVATIEGIPKEKLLKRDARQRRRVAIGASGLLVAAVAAAILAYLQRQRADAESETALAISLANEASAALTESHLAERGVLLALESIRRRHLPENDAVLRRALTLLPRTVSSRQHPQRVFSVAMSNNGRLVATGGGDGVTRVLTVPDLSPMTEGRQEAQVFELAFSPNDALVVSASGDGTVQAFDVASGENRWLTPTTGRAIAVAVSADGKFVATGTDKNEVMVLALATGRPIWRKQADAYVESVAFSPDSRFLVAAGGGTLHVFDPAAGAVLRSGQETARAVAFSKDGRRLAIAGEKVNVLAVGTWATETAFETGHRQAHVAFASDGNRVASTGTDGVVHVWEVGNQREAARFELGGQSLPMWLSFAPDGRTVASGWWDKTVRIVDASTGVEQWRVGHEGFALSGAFTPSGQYLVTGSNDGVARVSEGPDGGAVTLTGAPHLSMPLVVSGDGQHVAAVRNDRVLRVLDRRSGASVAEIPIGDEITALQFMPDGHHLVLALKETGVRVLDVRSRQVVWQVPIRGQVDGLAPTRDGKSVAVASWSGDLSMLDAQRGTTLWTASQGANLLGVSLSADSRRVTTLGAPTESRVLDAATGEVVWRHALGGTSAAALSDDGALVALALADESVVVYRLAEDSEVFRVPKQGTIVALAFSRDNRSLAVGGNHRTARVFDLASGVEQVRIPHDDAVWAVTFTPDDKLMTNQGFNVLRWHSVNTSELVADACSRVSRPLSQDEWARYLGNRPYHTQCAPRK